MTSTTNHKDVITVSFFAEDLQWLHAFLTSFSEGGPMDFMRMHMDLAKEVLERLRCKGAWYRGAE